MRMPSKKQYNLVTNEELDSRVPLHTEEAFTHGIKFSAKYIGTLDVPRPTSRVEIVAAMRRIRYEFKAKGIKKKKVHLEISVEGVRIGLRKKKKQLLEENQLAVMAHPIYRIFYVSHDSQDLKIFSYIARDAASNVFRCHVFKANKKSQAMKIVRTVGQAFEVCHKISRKDRSSSPIDDMDRDDACSRQGSEDASEKTKKDVLDSESGQEDLLTLTSEEASEMGGVSPLARPTKLESVASDVLMKNIGETYSSPLSDVLQTSESLTQAGTPLSIHHELQLMREQLEQQQQQTQAAVAQVHLLRDQLAAESAARLEAQARTHQLLVHNKELLEHIQQLVIQFRDMEIKLRNNAMLSSPTQIPSQTLPEVKSQEPTSPATGHLTSPQAKASAKNTPREDSCSTPSLSSESDPFRRDSSCPSSGESLTAGISQLYAMDHQRRLPQVPENSVPLTPYGPVPLGATRGPLNSPITRAASERTARRETLAQLQRMEWMRHTTK